MKPPEPLITNRLASPRNNAGGRLAGGEETMMARCRCVLLVACASAAHRTWQRAYPLGSSTTATKVVVPLPAGVVSAGEERVCVTADQGRVECHDGPLQVRQDEPVLLETEVLGAAKACADRTQGPCAATLRLDGNRSVDVAVYPWQKEPFVAVSWPPVGYVVETGAPLEIFFRIVGREIPADALVRVDFVGVKQAPAFLSTTTASVVLDAVEPATQVLGFSLVDAMDSLLGPRVEIALDAVPGDADLEGHRLRVAETETPTYDDDMVHTQEKIRLAFVGSMKMDGQKTIWLEQFARLDRSRFEPRFVSFMQDPIEEQRASTLATKLASLQIPLHLEPIPTISLDEAAEKPPDGPALAYDGRQAALDAFLLDRLDRAHGHPAKCQPAFARRTWAHLTGVFAALRPDVVIFANARESSDALLARAARVGRPTAKLLMELPNLFPHTPLDVDLLVAPSHYAATHPSVVRALPEKNSSTPDDATADDDAPPICTTASPRVPPGVVVVTPGVDAAVFDAARFSGDQAACHPHCRRLSNDQKGGDETKPCEPACETVGFLARVAPEKSPGLLIHAAAEVLKTRPFARFVVVGGGEALPALAELARVYGVSYAFDLQGPKYGPAALNDRYAAFDLVVNPSLRAWSETFCIANLEAMAVGRPLVSFGVGGVGEYLVADDGPHANGILLNSTKPAVLAEAILALLRDAPRRRRLAANARAAVLRRFLVQDQIRKYATLYTRLHHRLPIPPDIFSPFPHPSSPSCSEPPS